MRKVGASCWRIEFRPEAPREILEERKAKKTVYLTMSVNGE